MPGPNPLKALGSDQLAGGVGPGPKVPTKNTYFTYILCENFIQRSFIKINKIVYIYIFYFDSNLVHHYAAYLES